MTIIGLDASRAARAKRTGTETYSLEMIMALSKQANPQQRLRLYTPHAPQHGRWPNSPYVETRIIPLPRLWTHLRLAAELHQHPPDILFVPAHVLPLYCPVPALVTVHDVGYLHYPQAHPGFSRWYLNWTTRRHTRVARHIIADSQATVADLVHFYQADPHRITVVYLGRDESLTPVTKQNVIEQVKAKYNISGNYLLYIGTLHPRKNLVRLVKAFQMALSSLSPPENSLKLVIAGQKGWLYDEIFAQVQQLGLTEQVIFPGYLANKDKPALLSGALVYVFPSLYEGFGLPILEAMACNTPVLTSHSSSLPEVAGEAALQVDPHHTPAIATGLVELITKPDLRQQLIHRGQGQIKKFSWDAAATQILSIVENVTL